MYCHQCGEFLQNEHNFCPKCGTRVASKAVSTNSDHEEETGAVTIQLLDFDVELTANQLGDIWQSVLYEKSAARARDDFLSFFHKSRGIDEFLEEGAERIVGYYSRIVDSICESSEKKGIRVSPDDVLRNFNATAIMWMRELREKSREFEQVRINEKQLRETKKAGRTKFVGGGFGLVGAVKGTITAGAVNAVTGAVYSMANMIGDAATDNKYDKMQKVLMGADIHKGIANAVYEDCLHLYETNLDFGYTQEDRNAAYTTFKQLIEGKISEKDGPEAFVNMIIDYPADPAFYYWGLEKWGDRTIVETMDFFDIIDGDEKEFLLAKINSILNFYGEMTESDLKSRFDSEYVMSNVFGMIYQNGFLPFQTKDPMDFFHKKENKKLEDTTSVVYNTIANILGRSGCKDFYRMYDRNSPELSEVVDSLEMCNGAKKHVKVGDVPVAYISLDGKFSADSNSGTGRYLLITADYIFTKEIAYPIMGIADLKVNDYDILFNHLRVAIIGISYNKNQREDLERDLLNAIVFLQLLHNVGQDRKSIPVLNGWRSSSYEVVPSAWLFNDSSALMRPLDTSTQSEGTKKESIETEFKEYFENHPKKSHKRIEDVIEYAMFSFFPELASRMEVLRKDARKFGMKSDYAIFSKMFASIRIPQTVKVLHVLPLDPPEKTNETFIVALLLCADVIYTIAADLRGERFTAQELFWSDFANGRLCLEEKSGVVECVISCDKATFALTTTQEQSMILECVSTLHMIMQVYFANVTNDDYISYPTEVMDASSATNGSGKANVPIQNRQPTTSGQEVDSIRDVNSETVGSGYVPVKRRIGCLGHAILWFMTVIYGLTPMAILSDEGISVFSVTSAVVWAIAAVISCPAVKEYMSFWKKLVFPFLWIMVGMGIASALFL